MTKRILAFTLLASSVFAHAQDDDSFKCEHRYAKEAQRRAMVSVRTRAVGMVASLGTVGGVYYMLLSGSRTARVLTPTLVAATTAFVSGANYLSYFSEASFYDAVARAMHEARVGRSGLHSESVARVMNAVIFHEGTEEDLGLATLAKLPEATRLQTVETLKFEKLSGVTVAEALARLLEKGGLCTADGKAFSIAGLSDAILSEIRGDDPTPAPLISLAR